MSLPPDQNSRHKDEGEDRILQSVYDHVLRSVVVSYASNMHEMIKTGGISPSELHAPSSRQEFFPDLYRGKSPEEIQSLLEEYATEQIPNRRSNKRKLPLATTLGPSPEVTTEKDEEDQYDEGGDDDDDDDDEDFKDDDNDAKDEVEETHDTTKSTSPAECTPTSTLPHELEQQPPGVDTWGRIPPKEPKQPVECTLCRRHISTSRFASHLEKCMGISTRPLAGVLIRNASTSGSQK